MSGSVAQRRRPRILGRCPGCASRPPSSNLVVGDLAGNAARILDAYEQADAAGCDLVAFPELAITGYPPEDLLLKPAFVAQANETLEKLAARTGRLAAVDRLPRGRPRPLQRGRGLRERQGPGRSTASTCSRTTRCSTSSATSRRRPSTARCSSSAACRSASRSARTPGARPARSSRQAAGGAELIVNVNASPYYAGRLRERETMLATRAADAQVPVVYVNLVGGQDELVFDGASMVFDETGALVAAGQQFVEDLLIVDLDVRPGFRRRLLDPRGRVTAPPLPEVAVSEVRIGAPHDGRRDRAAARARARGLRGARRSARATTSRRTASSACSSGCPGGIDSSLVAAIAADALGPGPRDRACSCRRATRASHSVTDAEALAANLGIETMTVPIEEAHEAFTHLLAPTFAGTAPGLAEENLQARIRGTLLMAISNKFDWMVLTTGNKSEMATGYSTLYGDMAGGFAVIKDVPKMLVYALCDGPQPARGPGADPARPCSRSRRARSCARPEGRGLAAAVRGARRGARGLRRGGPVGGRDRGGGLRPRDRGPRRRARRLAASTSGARRRRASGSRRRRSARTAGCRSPTAGRADRHRP